MFKFEQLDVWRKAVDLSENIHVLTRNFPKEELYILTTQIKRAADSVALNIAEGSTGQSNMEFKKFLGYAVRSSVEVVSCLHIAKRRKLINDAEFKNMYLELESIIRMTQALKRSLQ